MNRFAARLAQDNITLRPTRTQILQVNVGKLCNLTCVHCHVNAGPKRKEIMTRKTIDRILDWLDKTDIPIIDLTGGAPELIPDFRYFVERVKALQPSRHVIDRCNLTTLLEPGYEDVAEFLGHNKVEIITSTTLTRRRSMVSCAAARSASAGAAKLTIAILISSSTCSGPAMAGASRYSCGMSIGTRSTIARS
jgi:hypothetical protein